MNKQVEAFQLFHKAMKIKWALIHSSVTERGLRADGLDESDRGDQENSESSLSIVSILAQLRPLNPSPLSA